MLTSSNTTYASLERLLEQARHRIEVAPEELQEARRRRDAIGAALRKEFSGARVYVNGSVAHGDALTPLTDVDLGVVVPDPDHQYGPGRRGSRDLKDRAANAIRDQLKPVYGDLRVQVEGRKRSIKVWFRDPVRPGAPDFTADIIVALDNLDGAGLLIPRYSTWDRSDPEKHTELVHSAIERSKVRYARTVRLLKHWNRQHDQAPICSWHIKVLALGCLQQPGSLLDGLVTWFDHTARELQQGPTPDPAGVGPDVNPLTSPSDAIRQARTALQLLREAIELENADWPVLAHAKLAEVFDDPQMLPAPGRQAVIAQEAERLRRRSVTDERRHTAARQVSVPARPAVRSWARP